MLRPLRGNPWYSEVMGVKLLVGGKISSNWHLLSTYQGPGTMLGAFYTSHFILSIT